MIAEVADRLRDTLARERTAIIALDTASLASLENEKLALLDDLRTRLPGAGADLGGTLGPILMEAEINALLLKDAVNAMSTLLGISETGVYDRTAKTARSSTSARRRVA